MKRIIFFTAFIFIYSNTNAQKFECGATSEWIQNQIINMSVKKKTNALNRSPSNIQYIPLAIWFIRNTDGSYSTHDDINVIYHSIGQTNRLLSQIGIQLLVSSVSYVDNSNLLKFKIEDAPNLFASHKDVNAANVYIIDNFLNANGTDAQYSGYGSPSAVYLSDITEGTFPHEFGHFFTLAHTFDVPAAGGAELVDGSNCATAGDKICDTPADPGASIVTHKNCKMTNNVTDANGELYDPPFANIMSYYGGMCGYEFTAGQYARMLEGFNTYHSAYTANPQISLAPTSLLIINKNGYDEVHWVNAAGSIGTQIEYSNDNGTNWYVMNTELLGATSHVISNTIANSAYKLRLRHINSSTYAEISYNPTISSVNTPIITQNDTYGMKEVILEGTSINHISNGNEYYTFVDPGTQNQLFIGGSYQLHLKPDNYVGHFSVYLDENGDGDFNDAGEEKYIAPDETDKWALTVNLNINQNASIGFTRLRIRTNQGFTTHDPTNFYNWSETEDYVIELVNETAPTALNAQYDANNNKVNLTWNDIFNNYKYVVERSVDGINFQQVAITSDGVAKSFDDATAPPGHQLEYRIKREGGSLYSNTNIVYTEEHNKTYCTPVSVNACGSNYGVSKVSVASLLFENTTETDCEFTSAGYSDYYATHSLAFNAGNQYTIDIENSAFNYSKYLAIFIDLDQNGQFDASERIYNQTSQSATPISSCVINIPSNAVNGETRMRIRNYFNSITDACSSANFGETEDYKVVISGGKEIEVINAKAENPTFSSIDLSWEVSTNVSPSGFIINQSTDGINFSLLTTLASNERSYTVNSLSNNTKYWFQIIESGTINSNPKTVWNTTFGSLSIDENLLNKEFKIYPIPFQNGKVKIESKNNIYLIKVIDLLGNIVLVKVKPDKFGNVYSIENIPTGMYILKIESDKGNLSKIIISKN